MVNSTTKSHHGKAVIFDLDGTLLDTLEDIGTSVNQALKAFKFPEHPIDSFRLFIGDGWRMLVTRALPEETRSEKVITECITFSRKIYTDNWNRSTRLYDGIPELLDKLKEKEVPMAVVSNKPQDFTLLYAAAYLSKWQFKVVLGQMKDFKPKPDPASALEVARRIGVPPKHFLFVGDSGVDMKTASAAGMHPVGVAWGFRGKEELKENGCQTIINEPIQLTQLLL